MRGSKAALAAAALAMEWSGGFCGAAAPRTMLARTPKEWAAVWALVGKPAPKADLSRFVGAAVFLGQKPTGGWGVEWLSPRQEADAVVLSYREKGPGGAFVVQAFTQPYAVKLFAKGAKPARLEAAP